MTYYAHSPKDGFKAQTYEEHVCNVRALAQTYAKEVEKYAKADGATLRQIADQAAEYHDLGKLDAENQAILSGEISAKNLPINHTDAGTAHWLNAESDAALSAIVIQSHHIGFPDFISESIKEEGLIFRDSKIAAEVDKKLSAYEEIHKSLISNPASTQGAEEINGDMPVFLRMLLSCVADADHTDTAINYGKYPTKDQIISLKAKKRLERLNEYVDELQSSSDDTKRNSLRREMYCSCRDFETKSGISCCESSVGSGKTTAVMAHLLAQAQKRDLRRIFVVLPFTNIIRQSVKKYREILTLPGENPNEIVAELHHRAEFESEDLRHLTALWRAPIIVTTAVAFFETLASDSPAALRRLHELPGSAVFVDESHAALPVPLLPIAWSWMKILSDEWSCYWVLASGSTNRFWEINEIAGNERRSVPEITDDAIRSKLSAYEQTRIAYRYDPKPKTAEELADWVMSFDGPRLIIVNTVQSAAVLASFIAEKHGREKVEHLSTALTPSDREAELDLVKARLDDKSDTDWVLVATSCIEAGVDISFRIGFRELSSLSSLLQAAGRINREGNDSNSEMWTFIIAEGGMLKHNPTLKQSGEVLKQYFEDNLTISQQLVTQSISDEIKLYGMNGRHKDLIGNEENRNFKYVEQNFKVIDSDTRLVIVDSVLAEKINRGTASWNELQRNSVQIAKYKLDELNIPRIDDDIYYWNLKYDNFIGYMAGIIERKKLNGQALII